MQNFIAVGDEHPIIEKDAKNFIQNVKKIGEIEFNYSF